MNSNMIQIECVSEEAWLETRKNYITATDIASFMLPYSTTYGTLKREPAEEQRLIGGIPFVGNLLEPHIINAVLTDVGDATLKSTSQDFIIYTDGKYSCSVDAIIEKENKSFIVECKSKYFEKDCNFSVRYLIQASMQSVILDKPAFVAVYSIVSDCMKVFRITKEEAKTVYDMVIDFLNKDLSMLQGMNVPFKGKETISKFNTIISNGLTSEEVVKIGIDKLKSYLDMLLKMIEEQQQNLIDL